MLQFFLVDGDPCVLPIWAHVTVVITLTHLPLECVFKPSKLPAVVLFIRSTHTPSQTISSPSQSVLHSASVVTNASLDDYPWTSYNTSAEPLASWSRPVRIRMNVDGRLKQPTEPSSYMKEVIHQSVTSENIPVSILYRDEYVVDSCMCCCWNLFFVCKQENLLCNTTQQIWFGLSENSWFELKKKGTTGKEKRKRRWCSCTEEQPWITRAD